MFALHYNQIGIILSGHIFKQISWRHDAIFVFDSWTHLDSRNEEWWSPRVCVLYCPFLIMIILGTVI